MLRKINVKAFGLAIGIVWAFGVFLLGFASSFGYGADLVQLLSRLYVGFGPTLVGSLIGALWAFASAFIGGVLIAWLYNKLAR